MKKISVLLVLLLVSSLLMFSCNQNEESISYTFEDVEKEFNFQRPLSKFSRNSILEKYETVENYRKFLIIKLKNDSLNKNKMHDDLIKARKLGNKNFEKDNLLEEKNSSGLCSGSIKVYMRNGQTDEDLGRIGQYFLGWDTILEDAEDCGHDLPYSCRAGACSSCVALQTSGTPISQAENAFLDDDQIGDGFALLCVGYATSNSAILTHVENELY